MSTSKPTAFAPLQESTLQVKSERTSQSSNKARLSKSELEAIFAKETWKLGKMFHNNIINLAASITAEVGQTQSKWLWSRLQGSTGRMPFHHGPITMGNGKMDEVDGLKGLECFKEYP
jgi:hypothetical protein